METSINFELAVYAAWGASLLLFMIALSRSKGLAPSPGLECISRPGLEVLYALSAIVILFVLSQLTDQWFATWKKIPFYGRIVFLVQLLVIYSPIILVLVWRKQGLDTCLLRREKLPSKLLVGLSLALFASLVFLGVRGRLTAYPQFLATVGEGGPLAMLQTFLEGVALGFLLYRFSAWIGVRWSAAIVAVLFMAAHVPVYMGKSFGLSLPIAVAMAAAHAGITVAVLLAMWKSQDIVVVGFLHWFINRASSF
jgi:hypothetical protein